MATRTWQNDVSNSFANDATRWGSSLSSGDTANMPVNDYDRSTSTTALGAVDLVDMFIGKGVRKSLGTSGSPLTFGACTGKLEIDAPLADAIYVQPTSWVKIVVKGTSQAADAFKLVDGTITDFVVDTPGRVKIGAAANITNLYVNSGTVYIENGAAITTIYQGGGVIEDYAGGWTTAYLNGGTHKALGDTSLTLGTYQIGGGYHLVVAPCTITYAKLNGPGGTLDFTTDSRAKTLTNAWAMKGSILDLRNSGIITLSNAPVARGGKILGAASVTLDIMGPA